MPGVDFTGNFAPVVNDVAFRIALTRLMVEGLNSMLMDVETAFLYGEVEEEIYMEVPVGMREIFSGPDEEEESVDIWIMSICQMVLEICQ